MVLGVDVGVTGALAWLDTTGELVIEDMPAVEHFTAAGGKRRHVNPDRLIELLSSRHADRAYIEKQWGQKGDGAIQAFGLGYAYGCLQTALGAALIVREPVASMTWRRWLKVPQGKAGGLHRARELFPAYGHYFKREKDHGRADAALIALWGMAQIGKVKLSWEGARATI